MIRLTRLKSLLENMACTTLLRDVIFLVVSDCDCLKLMWFTTKESACVLILCGGKNINLSI